MIHPLPDLNTLNVRVALTRPPHNSRNRQKEFPAFVEASQQREPVLARDSTLGRLRSLLEPSSASGLVRRPLRAREQALRPAGRRAVSPPRTASRVQRDQATARSSRASGAKPAPASHIPRFKDVPAWAKFPWGPYRQAPPEYGGEWWLVNPFTSEEPWKNDYTHLKNSSDSAEQIPEDFIKVFGSRPKPDEFRTYYAYRIAVTEWEQALEHFQGAGIPDGFDEVQVENAARVFEQWGMGQPVFYQGRDGWKARFPDSDIPSYENFAAAAIEASHLVIARYQVRLLREGITPEMRHPYVPSRLFGDDVHGTHA